MSPSHPSWWYDELAELRKKATPAGNGQSFQDFVQVVIGSDPQGWASQWAVKFANILNEYPAIGEMYKRLQPTFEFTIDPIQEMEILPTNQVRFPLYLDPADPVMGGMHMVRHLVIDALAHLLFSNADVAEQTRYENWFIQEGSLEPNLFSATEEVAFLFSCAVLGPDSLIDHLQQATPNGFTVRWEWLRDMIIVPNL